MTTPLSAAVINFHSNWRRGFSPASSRRSFSTCFAKADGTGCIAERGKNKATEMVALLHDIEIQVLSRVLFRFDTHAEFDGIIHHA